MEIYDVRLNNLRDLLHEPGNSPQKLAQLMGMERSSYLVQLAGPKPSRKISEKTARKIEKAANKPQGWLDTEHAGVTEVDGDLLAEAMEKSKDAMRKAKIELTSMQFAIVALIVYEHCQLKGGIVHAAPLLKKLADLLKGKAA